MCLDNTLKFEKNRDNDWLEIFWTTLKLSFDEFKLVYSVVSLQSQNSKVPFEILLRKVGPIFLLGDENQFDYAFEMLCTSIIDLEKRGTEFDRLKKIQKCLLTLVFARELKKCNKEEEMIRKEKVLQVANNIKLIVIKLVNRF